MKKNKKENFIINILATIFNPVGLVILAYLLFIIIGFYRQNFRANMPKGNWVDLYTIVDSFTDDTFTLVTEIPKDDLVAVPVKVYQIMDTDGMMSRYFLRNLNNKREHFYLLSTSDAYKKNEVLWIFFSTKDMVSGNTQDRISLVRDSPTVHRAEINISIDYWETKIQRISTRSGDVRKVGTSKVYKSKDGYTDVEMEYIEEHTR